MFGRATIRLGIGPHSSLLIHKPNTTVESDFIDCVLFRDSY